ncbi:MAG: class I tRNA ligase family protein, partial [Abiotrophia defectiva]|nr:class I tRNA ligase family protein [Abiotrophia defectiva]
SLITSVAVSGVAPYKELVSAGFVMDGNGNKMSKSLGNVIVPEEVMNELGADIIRLWVLSVDSESDVRISKDILKQIAEAYRKIRNTIRFMLSHVSDFDPSKDTVAFEDLRPVDQYMTAKFKLFANDLLSAYDKFEFASIYKKVINFMTVDLSAFYLDFAKDVLYIEAPNSLPRRQMQTVIYGILRDLLPLLTPVLLHTMEEAWKELPGVEGFVQLAEFPQAVDGTAYQALVDQWKLFFHVQQ